MKKVAPPLFAKIWPFPSGKSSGSVAAGDSASKPLPRLAGVAKVVQGVAFPAEFCITGKHGCPIVTGAG